MARWTDLATWVGPTESEGPAMVERRGLVVHRAEGSYEGTIAWQRNPAARVSSHFIVSEDGRVAQMVDTNTAAWTQKAGNGRWLSAEFAGHTPAVLTAAQLAACARLLVRAHQEYDVPLEVATAPSGRGLGHHSMGADWGHQACPGPAVIAQKPAIVSMARQIAGGTMAVDEDIWRLVHDGLRPGPNQTVGGVPIAWLPKQFHELDGAVGKLAADVQELKARPPVASAPVDPAVLKAVLLAPEVLAAIAAAVADEGHRRSES